MSKQKTSYLVCPITGLSVSYRDDWSMELAPNQHHLVANPKHLFALCEKQRTRIPNSYLIAGALLHLHQADKFSNPQHETIHLRGWISEQLQEFSSFQLMELYWDAKSGSEFAPQINLQSCYKLSPQAIYAQLRVAARGPEAPTYIAASQRAKPKPKKDNLAIATCCNRIAKKLTKLVGEGSAIGVSSAKRATSYIRWDKELAKANYQGLALPIQSRLIDILTTLCSEAIQDETIERDGLDSKSIAIIISHIKLSKPSSLTVGF